MNYLDPVILVHDHPVPILLANHFTVQFDGDALGGQRKKLEETVQTDLFLKLFDLAVDRDLHRLDSLIPDSALKSIPLFRHYLSTRHRSTVGDRPPQFDFFPVTDCPSEQSRPTRVEIRKLQVHHGQSILIG